MAGRVPNICMGAFPLFQAASSHSPSCSGDHHGHQVSLGDAGNLILERAGSLTTELQSAPLRNDWSGFCRGLSRSRPEGMNTAIVAKLRCLMPVALSVTTTFFRGANGRPPFYALPSESQEALRKAQAGSGSFSRKWFPHSGRRNPIFHPTAREIRRLLPHDRQRNDAPRGHSAGDRVMVMARPDRAGSGRTGRHKYEAVG
jgi:hypothetical protein